MSEMMVKAKPGTQCPRLDSRMPPIGDSKAEAVADIAYYRRRIADGSLIPATDAGNLSGNQAADDKKVGKGKA